MSIKYGFFVPHPPIIIPEIGKGSEKTVQATIDAYHVIAKKIAEIKPDTIIISSPHSTVYGDYFHISPGDKASGDFDQFGAKNISFEVRYDVSLRNQIVNEIEKAGLKGGIQGERDEHLDHAVLVPLYFINKYFKDYKLVRLSPSGMSLIDHYKYGMAVNNIPLENKVVWIASGDLSHKLKQSGPYGLAKEGPEFDRFFIEAAKNGDFDKILSLKPEFCSKAGECGLGSFLMMAGLFDGYNVKSELLSYQGDFGVGYGVISYIRDDENLERKFSDKYFNNLHKEINSQRANEDVYVQLARKSLEYYLQNKKILPIPNDIDKELLNDKAGVFVTLHKNGNLRGCIGTIRPTTDSIAEEIINNAVSAGTRDYRFGPVKIKELEQIIYSVDVLTKPTEVKSTSELDPKKYGVIVKHGFRSGLLLPNIEGVDTVKEQIGIALRKAGISSDEKFEIEKFEVIRHY